MRYDPPTTESNKMRPFKNSYHLCMCRSEYRTETQAANILFALPTGLFWAFAIALLWAFVLCEPTAEDKKNEAATIAVESSK